MFPPSDSFVLSLFGLIHVNSEPKRFLFVTPSVFAQMDQNISEWRPQECPSADPSVGASFLGPAGFVRLERRFDLLSIFFVFLNRYSAPILKPPVELQTCCSMN